MRARIEQIAAAKKVVSVFFPASSGGKLVNAAGTITEVADDFLILTDIYGNSMLVPYAGISYIEIKK